ncbi:hypothetical protein Tco_0646527 [Tanacetum coccineum]
MAAPVISTSSNVLVESVGSSFLRVILIGSISIEVPVAPEVGAAAVFSPAGVLELDNYSSLEADPLESSPPPVSVAPMVSPFLCLGDLESDNEMPKRHVSPTTSTPEILTAPILPAPSAIVAPSFEALTARKSVIPLYSHCLALRYASHHLDHFTFGSSSSHSSSDHSSSGHSILGHSLSGRTTPVTTDADSSTPLIFVHPPLSWTPRCSEAYLRWRSPAAIVTLCIHDTRALVPSRADLLPPRKRFRDSISPEDSVEEDIDTDVLEDIEANVMALVRLQLDTGAPVEAEIDACIGMEVDVGVDVEDEVESSDRGTMEVGVDVVARIDIPDAMLMPDAVERLERVEEGLQDIYDHVIEIPFQRIEDIEMGQRGFRGEGSLIASGKGELAYLSGVVRPRKGAMQVIRFRPYYDRMRFRRLETFAARRLATRAVNAFEAESQSQRKHRMNNGTGGRWKWWMMELHGEMEMVEIEMVEMEIQMRIIVDARMLFVALTWWNSHKRTIGAKVAFSMSRRELMKLMAEMVPDEEDQVEKFIGGLPNNIQGNVIAVEPTKIQDAVRIANNLMDQKLKGYAVKNAENKRRLEVNQRDNRGQHPPFKRPNVGGQNMERAYTAGNNERKPYNGPLPLCNKCWLHHEGPCTMRCGKCNKVRHLTQDCKVVTDIH